jgi:hypothetical protein
MQRFRFRLERVFEWRKRLCALEEDRLRNCLIELAHAEDRLAHLKAQTLATELEFSKHGALAVTDLRALAAYRLDSSRKERSLLSSLEAQLHEANQQRGKVVAERRHVQMMERLRNKSLREHQSAIDKGFDALALECYSSKLVSGKNCTNVGL